MAKKEMVLALSLLLLIWISNGQTFDYYQVVLQWQPATCSNAALNRSCDNIAEDKFSIHGVWPSMFDGSYHAPCSGIPPYDDTEISSIRDRLDQDWPSVIYNGNSLFWSHEWNKHGTCTSLSQLQYFEFGLDKYRKHNVLTMLKEDKIDPDGHSYERTKVRDAIRNRTGKFPALRCNTNDGSGRTQLHEIVLCFDKNLDIQHCLSKTNTCNFSFYWYNESLSSSSSIKAVDNRATAPYDVV